MPIRWRLLATLAPLAAIGSPAYIQLALAVTVLVGVMQWLIGALRLGTIANFISPAALRGFMSGAALLIALHSLTDLLGLAKPEAHGSAAVLVNVVRHLEAVSPAALLVAGSTFVDRDRDAALDQALPGAARRAGDRQRGRRAARPAPGSEVATIGTIPPIWPRLHWPGVELGSLPELLSIALALTIVALGQSISIAKAVAARSGQPIDANREFRGQGLSNIVGGFFSSYVSCGSLNRSMPNFEAGARTPLAAVFASVWLLLLIALTAPLLAHIALAAIAALLLLIAWSLLDIGGWRRLWRESRQEFAIAAVTAAATVTIRIEMAILLGTILSLAAYLHRTSHPYVRVMGFDSSCVRASVRGARRCARSTARMPAAEDDPDGGRGLLRRGAACRATSCARCDRGRMRRSTCW